MEGSLMGKTSLNALALRLSEKTGLNPQETEVFIRKMFEVVNDGLRTDKQVKMKWLGTFKVTSVKDRESVNVNTGERIVIEGRDKITFAPDSILKEIVNKPFAQFETVVVNDGVDFEEIDRKFEAEEESDGEEADKEEKIVDSQKNTVSSKEEAADSQKMITESDDSSDNETDSFLALDNHVEDTSTERIIPHIPDQGLSTSDDSGVVCFSGEETKNEVSDEVIVIGDSEKESSCEDSLDEDKQEQVIGSQQEQVIRSQQEQVIGSQQEQVESEVKIPRHRTLVLTVCAAVLALIGAIGWFAYNRFGSLQALIAQQEVNKEQPLQTPKISPIRTNIPSSEETMRKKAVEDSVRMAQASEVIRKVDEKSERSMDEPQRLPENQAEIQNISSAKSKKGNEIEKQQVEQKKQQMEQKKLSLDENQKQSAAKYDKDVRVRTGAYRIIGVSEVVTVKEGQSISALSKRYLGPGMECYVEALNGCSSELKAGQKIKIPKLELKKKK